MSTNKLVDFIKGNFPEQAVEISYSLELVQEVLKDTEQKINKELTQSTEEKQFDQARNYIDRLEELEQYKKQLNKILNQISQSDNKKNKNEELPDYEKYKVNNKKSHGLEEDFTNKRPYAFSLEGTGRQVNTWREMFKETCYLLIQRDKDHFLNLINDEDLQGRTRDYFATSGEEIINPLKVEVDGYEVYLETNLSANRIIKLISRLLDKYEINREKYDIYLRADYSTLHD